MTYRYKTQIQLCLNTGDRAGHMYDKAHAQQQQQRRATQTLHRTAYIFKDLFRCANMRDTGMDKGYFWGIFDPW